jgi:ribonuclease Z
MTKLRNLRFLGTAGYHPNDDRHTSCLFIPEAGLMLDAGTGLYRAIQHIQTDALDIFLSHAHLDHVIGLSFLLDVQYASSAKTFRVYGEAEKLSAIREHLFHRLLFPIEPKIEWIPLETLSPRFEVAGGRVGWFPLHHPGGSVGYRFDWPEYTLSYVTDTTARPDASYWPKVVGSDYLVHECNFTDEQFEFAELTGHSWPAAVIDQARAHQIGRLVLTHINPLANDADPLAIQKRILPDEAPLIAKDGDIITMT